MIYIHSGTFLNRTLWVKVSKTDVLKWIDFENVMLNEGVYKTMHIAPLKILKYTNNIVFHKFVHKQSKEKRGKTFLGRIQTNLRRVVTQEWEGNSMCKDCSKGAISFICNSMEV